MNGGSIRGQVLIFPGALGDFLLALPALRMLGQRHGGRTTLVVSDPLRALARLTGAADEVASLDDASSAWLFGGSVLPRWLAGRPAVRCWLGGAGVAERLAAVADPVTVSRVERGAGRRHAAAAYAAAAGLHLSRSTLWRLARLALPPSAAVRRLLATLRRPALALHRGAGAPAKRWDPEAFQAIVTRWRRAGGSVVEILGPAELGDPPLEGVVPVRGWALAEVGALLAQVDAYVGNDSGVSHLAAAVGVRTVAVFTATAPQRWRPLGPQVVALPSVGATGLSGAVVDRVLEALIPVESLTSTHLGSSVRPSRHSTRLRQPASTTAEDGPSASPLDADGRFGVDSRNRRRR